MINLTIPSQATYCQHLAFWMWMSVSSHTIIRNLNCWCYTLIGTATMENSTEIPLKTKNRTTISSCNTSPEHTHPEKNMVRKDTCTPMVNAALFIIAKTWKQLQLSTSRGMDKEDVVHIYNRILLSHYKEWNNAICSNRNGPRDCCTEWNKSEKEKYVWYCLYAK